MEVEKYIPGWKDFRKLNPDELLVEYIKMFPEKTPELFKCNRPSRRGL